MRIDVLISDFGHSSVHSAETKMWFLMGTDAPLLIACKTPSESCKQAE